MKHLYGYPSRKELRVVTHQIPYEWTENYASVSRSLDYTIWAVISYVKEKAHVARTIRKGDVL